MRAYGRRHRRWRNRNAQPLMIVADGSYFADFLAASGRLLFRYRSELAPFNTMIALVLAGWVLHATYPHAWPVAAAVASVAAAVLAYSALL